VSIDVTDALPPRAAALSERLPRVGVHAREIVDFYVDARLLLDLARDGHGDGLSPGSTPPPGREQRSGAS